MIKAKESGGAELKPCPFCGGEASFSRRNDEKNDFYDIFCNTKNCFLESGGDYWLPKAQVAEIWNKRNICIKVEDRLPEHVKDLIEDSVDWGFTAGQEYEKHLEKYAKNPFIKPIFEHEARKKAKSSFFELDEER